MNLAQYVKMDVATDYISFEKTGDTKYLRFVYESGGDAMGNDITMYRKYYDEEAKKYVINGDKGAYTVALRCIEYDADGKNPRFVIWERSAYFVKNTLLPLWREYPRIIDGVWKITATSPKTKDASYAVFPVVNADTIKYPLIEVPDSPKEEAPKAEAKPEEPVKTEPKKKYWE